VIVYWVGPWLGVVLTDQYLRRGRLPTVLLYDRGYRNPAGVVALLVGILVSVPLFSNRVLFVGLVPRLVPGVGDLTFFVGTTLSAAVYALLFPRFASAGGRRSSDATRLA
jgi:NCS1 family nucleobase:cation symporter-1